MAMVVRQDWLDQVSEAIIEPDRRIIDPHHHFFVQSQDFPYYDLASLQTDTATHRVDVEAAPVSALQDTVGAGDTFMAALIYQFLQSPDFTSETAIRDVGRFAAKAAAINCERVGCNPPSLDEIRI